ncbi:DUF3907 family protein [Pontibacillus yanchengensis]|uniref:DUF3907 family protein n=2 Tax=Pontibacillus yanchengensis TaxID=462910 RepID=A0ACC7VJY8_9BACI|nr:DUF3907 family protein [Pontibacillus yanchengensis]MYL32689.1 DUF3907 family protein [Pontibacillus yanchengensis]MYL55083.1 DUF3907 family protein [Pontibacillus yanchengensis]
MNNQLVMTQLEEVRDVLGTSVRKISHFLNQYSIQQLLEEEGSHDKGYYALLLKALRRLEVFCDEAYEKVQGLMNSQSFHRPVAEKALYGIYHQCIMEFFSPKSDAWGEDSRAAYTGKNAITYFHQPPYALRKLMNELEDGFQQIREDLAFYESDYFNRKNDTNKRSSS